MHDQMPAPPKQMKVYLRRTSAMRGAGDHIDPPDGVIADGGADDKGDHTEETRADAVISLLPGFVRAESNGKRNHQGDGVDRHGHDCRVSSGRGLTSPRRLAVLTLTLLPGVAERRHERGEEVRDGADAVEHVVGDEESLGVSAVIIFDDSPMCEGS
jgi:hypothetical protein